MTDGEFITGLDLGKRTDYSALVSFRKVMPEDGDLSLYECQRTHRFDLGTPYTQICRRVAAAFQQPPLKDSTLVVDATGVGQGVMDLLAEQDFPAHLVFVVITGGHQSRRNLDGSYHVPKKDLVAAVHVTLDRISLATGLQHADILRKELRDFRVVISKAANEIYEAREGDKDDLVLSAAMALWVGENLPGCNTWFARKDRELLQDELPQKAPWWYTTEQQEQERQKERDRRANETTLQRAARDNPALARWLNED